MERIKNYLKTTGIPIKMLEEKIALFQKHTDIAEELIYWIENKCYKKDGVSRLGYSAKDIANKSAILDGFNAFNFLIMLREKPEYAKKKLNSKLKLK